MSDRSTLRTLLESIGTDILQIVAAPSGLDVPVAHPVIDDQEAPASVDEGDMLLAVGTTPSSPGLGSVLERAGRGRAAAVLFRDTGSGWAAAISLAETHGVAVIGVVPEMAWSQLHTLLRSAVAASASSSPEVSGAGAIGDLFALANAIAAMVGGPTTIEDPQS